MSSDRATWYFDYVSPYAYLQSELLSRRENPVAIAPQPVLLAGLLNHFGQLGPAEIAPKRRFTYRHIRWLARHHQIPLNFPDAHPFNPLPLLRATLVAGAEWPTIRRLFRFVWAEGHLPEGSPLEDLLSELGLSPAHLADPGIKEQLRSHTEDAIAAGVFGVPTIRHGELLFWGADATAMFFEAVSDPRLHDDAEARRLDRLPVGAARPR